jgi:hypothetical protein
MCPKNGDDIPNVRQMIVMYHHYVSDFASFLIRKGMSLRNLAVGWHETIKFIRKVYVWCSCLNLFLPQMTTSQHTEHQSFTKEQNQLTLKVGVLSTSSPLSVPLPPTESHLLYQVRFAALSRRAQELVAIILRNSFQSIQPSRLCILMAYFLNSPLAVYSCIITRTVATAYNITTDPDGRN